MKNRTLLIIMMGMIGGCRTATADIKGLPNDSLINGAYPGREGKLPPINPTRPNGVVDPPLVCSYGPGFLELALPPGVQYAKVRLFNSTQDWSCIVTVEQPRVEIPLFTGECRIICWTDDERQYSGKLFFPEIQ